MRGTTVKTIYCIQQCNLFRCQ